MPDTPTNMRSVAQVPSIAHRPWCCRARLPWRDRWQRRFTSLDRDAPRQVLDWNRNGMQPRGVAQHALRQDVETPKTSPQLGKGIDTGTNALEDAPFEVAFQCSALRASARLAAAILIWRTGSISKTRCTGGCRKGCRGCCWGLTRPGGASCGLADNYAPLFLSGCGRPPVWCGRLAVGSA